jgi:hypothetical protein
MRVELEPNIANYISAELDVRNRNRAIFDADLEKLRKGRENVRTDIEGGYGVDVDGGDADFTVTGLGSGDQEIMEFDDGNQYYLFEEENGQYTLVFLLDDDGKKKAMVISNLDGDEEVQMRIPGSDDIEEGPKHTAFAIEDLTRESKVNVITQEVLTVEPEVSAEVEVDPAVRNYVKDELGIANRYRTKFDAATLALEVGRNHVMVGDYVEGDEQIFAIEADGSTEAKDREFDIEIPVDEDGPVSIMEFDPDNEYHVIEQEDGKYTLLIVNEQDGEPDTLMITNLDGDDILCERVEDGDETHVEITIADFIGEDRSQFVSYAELTGGTDLA